MIDIILLRIIRHRKDFTILSPLIVPEALSEMTREIIKDYARYFETFPSHDMIDITTFMTRFPQWHKGIKEERVREFARIMQNAMPLPDDDQKAAVLQELADANFALKMANITAEYNDGELQDLMGVTMVAMDEYKRSRNIKQVKFIDTHISELLAESADANGVEWRLRCLNKSMRPLQGGDFGIIAGRPDQGKTSFIASEISHMAPQLHPDKNVLWLNNEGKGSRIIPRIWQAALNLTISEMREFLRQNLLEDRYLEVMGRFDKVRVVDIHGLNNSQVEMIIESNNPGIIVYDMIDNIGGFGDAARTDLKLEYMYQWGRERSVKYDAIGLATSQISADGDGLQFPTLAMLKDSKTGKQGACDFQLMIGSVHDPNMMSTRFIGLPKNKMQRDDGPKDPRAEVYFDMRRSRYKDNEVDPTTGV